MDLIKEMENYFRFCLEFSMEWTNYTEESLLRKDEVEFFKIFQEATKKQQERQRQAEME